MYKLKQVMRFGGINLLKYLMQFFILGICGAFILVGWTWLLHFPWEWAVKLMCYIQGGLVLLLIYSESSASSVNGAAGWMSFGFFFFELFLFIGLGVLKVAIVLIELLSKVVL